ncbi:MAG: hypothetical protein QM613_00470 [Micrococcaceae bacterium]
MAETAKAKQIILVDVNYLKEVNQNFLEIVVDINRVESITLDEVADFSNLLSKALDEENLIDEAYELQVFSPGADMPLTEERHFQRAINKVVLVTKNDKKIIRGILLSANEDEIVIEQKKLLEKGKAPKKSDIGKLNISRDDITNVIVELPN